MKILFSICSYVERKLIVVLCKKLEKSSLAQIMKSPLDPLRSIYLLCEQLAPFWCGWRAEPISVWFPPYFVVLELRSVVLEFRKCGVICNRCCLCL